MRRVVHELAVLGALALPSAVVAADPPADAGGQPPAANGQPPAGITTNPAANGRPKIQYYFVPPKPWPGTASEPAARAPAAGPPAPAVVKAPPPPKPAALTQVRVGPSTVAATQKPPAPATWPETTTAKAVPPARLPVPATRVEPPA